MDNEIHGTGTCPIGRGAARVPDLWSIMILRDAGLGRTRFDDFRKSLGIAPNILTRRLGALVEDGLLEKRRYSQRPPRDEYVLTARGRDYLPVLPERSIHSPQLTAALDENVVFRGDARGPWHDHCGGRRRSSASPTRRPRPVSSTPAVAPSRPR